LTRNGKDTSSEKSHPRATKVRLIFVRCPNRYHRNPPSRTHQSRVRLPTVLICPRLYPKIPSDRCTACYRGEDDDRRNIWSAHQTETECNQIEFLENPI